MKKININWAAVILASPFILIVALVLIFGKTPEYPTYQYTITYTVYYPTETKRVTKTGTIEAPNDIWRPRAEKKVKLRGVKIKVWPDVVYDGKSDAEINSFTYRKL
jgi:hypothetical protein